MARSTHARDPSTLWLSASQLNPVVESYANNHECLAGMINKLLDSRIDRTASLKMQSDSFTINSLIPPVEQPAARASVGCTHDNALFVASPIEPRKL